MAHMLALTLAFGVVGFGVATAIYLEKPAPPMTVAAPRTTVALPAAPHDPTAAAQPVRVEPPPPPAAALAALEPQAGSSAAQTAALAPPAAVPAPALAPPPVAALPVSPPPAAAATRPYWVEYGVFVRAAPARRLQQTLSRQGLAAVVVETHGRHGRRLLRVRSAPLSDLAAARQAASAARRTLHLATLLHRGSPAAAPAPRYRVQFAAFAQPKPAARLSRALRRRGIATSVSKVRGASGKPLYLVRSVPIRDRGDAVALGARGRSLVQGNFLVEERPRRADTHAAARPPPRPVADSR